MCFIFSHVVPLVVFCISLHGFRLLVSFPSLLPEELLLAFLVGQLWTLSFCLSGNVLVSSFLKDNFCWIESYSVTAVIFYLISALWICHPIALWSPWFWWDISLSLVLLRIPCTWWVASLSLLSRFPLWFFPVLIMVCLGQWLYLLKLLVASY